MALFYDKNKKKITSIIFDGDLSSVQILGILGDHLISIPDGILSSNSRQDIEDFMEVYNPEDPITVVEEKSDLYRYGEGIEEALIEYFGDQGWSTGGGGGGGGGAIALQQNGVEVQSAASTLNFTDGLDVDSAGNVSLAAPAGLGVLEWGIDYSKENAGAVFITPTLVGAGYTGQATVGFGALPAAGFSATLAFGSYTEFTIDSTPSSLTFMSFMTKRVTGGEIIEQGREGGFVLLLNESTWQVIDAEETREMVVEGITDDTFTFGIEALATGYVVHQGGNSTVISSPLETPLAFGSVTGDALGDTISTILVNTAATLPAGVQAGTVAIGEISNLQHPDEVYPEGVAEVIEAATSDDLKFGTNTNIKTYTPQVLKELKKLSIRGNNLSGAGSAGSVGLFAEIEFNGATTSGRLKTYSSGDRAYVKFEPAPQPTQTNLISSTNGTIYSWSPSKIHALIVSTNPLTSDAIGSTIREELKLLQHIFLMNSGTMGATDKKAEGISNSSRTSTGEYKFTTVSTNAGQIMIEIEIYDGAMGDQYLLRRTSSTNWDLSVQDSSNALVDRSIMVKWTRKLN